MLNIARCIADIRFAAAPSTLIAASVLLGASFDAGAKDQSVAIDRPVQTDHGAQRYAQNQPLHTQPSPSSRKAAPQPLGPTKVYLLRGLMNVFSLGMDDLATKIEADGIWAMVTNHADADLVASRILTGYNGGDHGPVVLIGHSLGADAIVEVADTLAHYSVPVALLVLYDGTDTHQIPGNVTTAINYTKHFMIVPAPGSRSVISNVDLSTDPGIDHLNIDTTPSLQAQTINYVLQAGSAMPRRQ